MRKKVISKEKDKGIRRPPLSFAILFHANRAGVNPFSHDVYRFACEADFLGKADVMGAGSKHNVHDSGFDYKVHKFIVIPYCHGKVYNHTGRKSRLRREIIRFYRGNTARNPRAPRE